MLNQTIWGGIVSSPTAKEGERKASLEHLHSMLQVYRQHKLDLVYLGDGGGGCKGGRVNLGGMGSKCDRGVLYKIPKQLIKILCWGKEKQQREYLHSLCNC